MSNVLNVKLGTCKVYFGGTDLGHTIGGVEVTYTPEYHETKVDEFAGPAERWLVGEKMSAKVPLAENVLSVIKEAITHATDNSDHITVGSKAGKRSSTYAKLLVLHPVANEASDYSDDVGIYKAHVANEITIGYKNDGEQIIEAMFEGLVDENREDGNLLGMIGDST